MITEVKKGFKKGDKVIITNEMHPKDARFKGIENEEAIFVDYSENNYYPYRVKYNGNCILVHDIDFLFKKEEIINNYEIF